MNTLVMLGVLLPPQMRICKLNHDSAKGKYLCNIILGHWLKKIKQFMCHQIV